MFFLGVFLTGFSSSYYHWKPNDAGLFWDRLPMTVAFMAILANVDRGADRRAGRQGCCSGRWSRSASSAC